VARRGGSERAEQRLKLRGVGGRRGFGVAVAIFGVIQDRVGEEVTVLHVGGLATTGEGCIFRSARGSAGVRCLDGVVQDKVRYGVLEGKREWKTHLHPSSNREEMACASFGVASWAAS
jgi:hypothetical protein